MELAHCGVEGLFDIKRIFTLCVYPACKDQTISVSYLILHKENTHTQVMDERSSFPTTRSANSNRPSFLIVRNIAKILCSDVEGFPLFDFDIRTHPPENFLSVLYNNHNIFTSMETILQYIFTTAEKSWVVEETVVNTEMISKIKRFYSNKIPGKTVNTVVNRHVGKVGESESAHSPGINMQTRKYTVNGIVLANYIKGRNEDSEFGHCADIDIVSRASQVCQAMQDFLSGLCEQDRSGIFYNPSQDPLLRSAWRKIVVYLDSFLTWISTGRPVGKALMRSTLECISHVTSLLETVQIDNTHLVPYSLAPRLECCKILCQGIMGGSVNRGYFTTVETPTSYPPRSSFHPSHPCDLFLKSLMGDPGDVLEPISMSIHNKMSGLSERYKAAEVDKLTGYITQRRYTGSSGKSFLGGISCMTWEAVLHALLHQGNQETSMSNINVSPTVSSGYDPLKSFFIPFVRSLQPCAWFPGTVSSMLCFVKNLW